MTEIKTKNKTSILLLDKDEGFIRYITKSTNKIDWYTYNEDLLEILTGRICPDYDRGTGRTRFAVRDRGKTLHICANDLALGCYLGHIRSSTLIQDWKRFVQHKQEYGFNVDHLDDNGDNITFCNISLMDASVNQRKAGTIQRIKLPNALSAVYRGNGKYGVELMTYPDTDGSGSPVGSVRFLCEGAEEFVDCLSRLTESPPLWAVPMKKASGRWLKAESGYLYGDTARSIERQAYLSRLDDSEFMRYDQNQLLMIRAAD